MKTIKKALALLLVVVLSAALAGCGAVEGGDGVLRTLYASELSTLNYLVSANQSDHAVGANCVDTLIEYDKYGMPQSSLAESWTQSPDGLTWTFALRHGVGWYDYQGNYVAELTAHDFVAAAKYALTAEYASQCNNPLYIIKNAERYYEGEISDFSLVGVKALGDYTLEYTLEAPAPYFLSSLTYVCYMPAYAPQLEQLGSEFGTSNDSIYYCGAYIMTEYVPQVRQVFERNNNNWDSEHIYIRRIEKTYNAEAANLAPVMVLRGELDYATIGADILGDWQLNHPEYLSPGREKCDYSYFFCFNFDPQFSEEYQPENWSLAVNNTNFRKSVAAALDLEYISSAHGEGAAILQSTVTPAGFAISESGDYAAQPELQNSAIAHSEQAALGYKQSAIEELTAAGAEFPIKMLVVYRPDDAEWVNESVLLEQQLESVLGTEYIDVILQAGPTESFLSRTRRAGDYAFMKCNWGADYIDPQTFTDPFADGNSYNFCFTELGTGSETDRIITEYYRLVEDAKSETADLDERYALFAKAESLLLQNAVVVPYMVTPLEYTATKTNVFDRQYASCGISILRYKGLRMSEQFISAEQFEQNRLEWESGAAG